MKHEFEAVVCEFSSKTLPVYPSISIPYAIMEADGIQDDDEYVKFVVCTDNLVQWNGQKVRVTIETE